MTLLRLVSSTLHKRVTAPGGIGGECVDLANCYLGNLWSVPPVRLNAHDWAAIRIPGWTWIANEPTNSPALGSLVVWHLAPIVGVGANGHIAIALFCDPMQMLTYDQNWPPGSGCEFVSHTYAGVSGWHAPPTPPR